jgi:hypothetical protein
MSLFFQSVGGSIGVVISDAMAWRLAEASLDWDQSVPSLDFRYGSKAGRSINSLTRGFTHPRVPRCSFMGDGMRERLGGAGTATT